MFFFPFLWMVKMVRGGLAVKHATKGLVFFKKNALNFLSWIFIPGKYKVILFTTQSRQLNCGYLNFSCVYCIISQGYKLGSKEGCSVGRYLACSQNVTCSICWSFFFSLHTPTTPVYKETSFFQNLTRVCLVVLLRNLWLRRPKPFKKLASFFALSVGHLIVQIHSGG